MITTTYIPGWLARKKEWEVLSGSDRALWFVDGVLSGDLPARLRTRQACQRFRDMMEVYQWEPARVDWAVNLIETMEAPTGAFNTLVVLPWQAVLTAVVHGFRTAAGTRAFTDILLMVPRKAGKSAFVAALTLIEMVFPYGGEKSPHIALVGVNAKTATHTYLKMMQILAQDRAKYKREGYAGKNGFRFSKTEITCESGGLATTETLGAKSLDGYTLHGYVIDEVGSIADRAGMDTLSSGMGHVDNRFVLLTTTPGDLFNSVLDGELEGAIRVLDGDDDRPHYFPFLFRAEEDDKQDAGDPKLWEAVQPSLSWSTSPDFYAEQWAKAKAFHNKRHNFYTRYLCAPSIPRGIWIKRAQVEKTPDPPPMSRSLATRWLIGIDLSDVEDLTSITILGYDDNRHHAYVYTEVYAPKSYLPEDGAVSREAGRIMDWHEQGWITVHGEGAIDHAVIADRLTQLTDKLLPFSIYSDTYSAVEQVQALAPDRVRWRMRQKTKSSVLLADPMNMLTTWVQNGTVSFQKNPVLLDHLDNVVVKINTFGGRTVQKQTPDSPHKIDAVDSLLMAVRGYVVSKSFQEAGKPEAPIMLPDILPGEVKEGEEGYRPVVFGGR